MSQEMWCLWSTLIHVKIKTGGFKELPLKVRIS